eukprot:TRINITY_DN4223_c0_g1_i2.p1 TRINITY_DN4223_c0_g1~~TRINITY_DN4223_c0_g1_i2.p1  ORF type:complete len:205 (+),score=62.56 TRINITY_DN4223_c0_g1_i2:123-737(+)
MRRAGRRCHLASAAALAMVVASLPMALRWTFVGLAGMPSKALRGASRTALAAEDVADAPDFSRRTAAASAVLPLLVAMPTVATAAGRGRSENGGIYTGGDMGAPKSGETEDIDMSKEGLRFEEWTPTEVLTESTLVDPNDPKYKELKVIAQMERQQKKNEKYDNMSKEEKQRRACEVLGRGCQSIQGGEEPPPRKQQEQDLDFE